MISITEVSIWGDTKTNPRGNTLQSFVEASDFTLYTPGDKTFVCSGNGGSIIDLMLVSGHINHLVSNYWIEQRMDLGSGAPLRGHFPMITSLSLKSLSRQCISTIWTLREQTGLYGKRNVINASLGGSTDVLQWAVCRRYWVLLRNL